MNPRRAVLLAVIALLVVGYAVWQSRPPSELSRLMAMPEAVLGFPGSSLIASGGSEPTTGIDGTSSASTLAQFGSDADLEEILSFYERTLEGRGWSKGAGTSVIGYVWEAQVCSWHTDSEVIRVSFWRPSDWAERNPNGPTFATVYEVRLLDGPPPLILPSPCWKPRQ